MVMQVIVISFLSFIFSVIESRTPLTEAVDTPELRGRFIELCKQIDPGCSEEGLTLNSTKDDNYLPFYYTVEFKCHSTKLSLEAGSIFFTKEDHRVTQLYPNQTRYRDMLLVCNEMDCKDGYCKNVLQASYTKPLRKRFTLVQYLKQKPRVSTRSPSGIPLYCESASFEFMKYVIDYMDGRYKVPDSSPSKNKWVDENNRRQTPALDR